MTAHLKQQPSPQSRDCRLNAECIKADCAYVTSAEDERECRRDARRARAEKGEECKDVYEARLEICDLVGEARYDIEFEPTDFVDPNNIGTGIVPNQYWPLTAGHTQVIVAESEDDEGELVKEVVVVTATEEVRDIGGIPCRVNTGITVCETSETRLPTRSDRHAIDS